MGYNCTAVFDFKIDDLTIREMLALMKDPESGEFASDEIYYKYRRRTDGVLSILEKLQKKPIHFSFSGIETPFIRDINDEYALLNRGIFAKTSGTEIGKDGGYISQFDIKPNLINPSYCENDPMKILDVLIFIYQYSLEFPTLPLYLGVGDAGYFWLDLTVKSGTIEQIKAEYLEDYKQYEEGTHAFTCSVDEIQYLFEQFQQLMSGK
jgi:hypothetical protein